MAENVSNMLRNPFLDLIVDVLPEPKIRNFPAPNPDRNQNPDRGGGLNGAGGCF